MAYRGTSLTVFYHCARLGTWETVDAEITRCLNASGLLDHAAVVRNETDGAQFEFPTIDLLRQHCADNDGAVLYIHTKGVVRSGPSIDDWRAAMLYWMVERWRECVDKLIKGYDAVGYTRCERPVPHFQGNFWWAKCAHVRTLGDPRDIRFIPSVSNQGPRHKAEFWILSKPGRFYEPYSHRPVRPYADRNPRSTYEGRRF
jgi:hypothetical protein